jgi:hypothetical protein
MIEVRVVLEHEGEVALFAEFTQILRRNRRIANGTATPADTAPRAAESPSVTEPIPNLNVETETTEPAVVGQIGPDGIEISDAQIIEAFQKYAASKPFAEMVALVQSYGAKRVGEIAQEKRGAFLAQLGGK